MICIFFPIFYDKSKIVCFNTAILQDKQIFGRKIKGDTKKMCYFEDCEDRYWPREDNTPDCPYEDCDNSTDTGNTNPGGTGSTNPGNSGNTGTSGGQSQSGNCPCDCDNSTDTGNTKPGGSGNTGTSGGQNQGGNCPCNCDNRTDTGNTKPGGSHICICNCDDCADGTCGTTRYYKPGESFCLYASHSDYYAWSTEPSIIFVGTDGKAVAIREGSAYICIRSRSNPAFRHCIRVVATNTPPVKIKGSTIAHQKCSLTIQVSGSDPDAVIFNTLRIDDAKASDARARQWLSSLNLPSDVVVRYFMGDIRHFEIQPIKNEVSNAWAAKSIYGTNAGLFGGYKTFAAAHIYDGVSLQVNQFNSTSFLSNKDNYPFLNGGEKRYQ